MKHIIEVNNLCKSFNGKMVVDHVSLSVSKGEIYGFLGPNGSGKTTTIRMICGLLTPDSGEGQCLGYDIVKDSEKIKNHVGYMTQHFSLYADLTVEENLYFIARVYAMPRQKARVEEILSEMGLEKRRRQLTRQLSGGWKQRVALAACLLHKPQLLLLDEPTAGVDPLARREFWDKIHSLSEQGITTLVSTHYMDEAERCTRLAYLSLGKLVITGTVSEVIAATQLLTWVVEGQVNNQLFQTMKTLPGVSQAALFGHQIHIFGYDQALVEQGLKTFTQEHGLSWRAIQPTLEDAFISLVKKTQGDF